MTKPAIPKGASKELVADLDRAAKLLLGAAFPDSSSDTEPQSEETAKAVLADQIKAFGAVSHWAIERTKIVAPPPAEKGKGERLRAEFHSTAGRKARRGNGAAEAKDPAADDGS